MPGNPFAPIFLLTVQPDALIHDGKRGNEEIVSGLDHQCLDTTLYFLSTAD